MCPRIYLRMFTLCRGMLCIIVEEKSGILRWNIRIWIINICIWISDNNLVDVIEWIQDHFLCYLVNIGAESGDILIE